MKLGDIHPITKQLVGELDLLYGLYQLAIEYGQKITPDDDQAGLWLDAREKILHRTDIASKEVVKLLQQFESVPLTPANEKALVEEKRFLIADLGLKMKAADNRTLKAMQIKLAEIRGQMASQTERKNAMRAYIQAPLAQAYN